MRLLTDGDRYQPLTFSDFNLGKPEYLLDEHPDGIHGALKSKGYAAVWNRRTGQLVWVPKLADLLC